MSDFINPIQSFTQGFGVGQGLNQQVLNNEAQQFQLQQAQLQAQIAEQQRLDSLEQQENLNNLYGIVQSGNASAQDYMNLAMALPAEQAKSVRDSFSVMTESQQQSALNETGQIFAAFKAGSPEIAVNLMEDQRQAYINAGDAESARMISQYIDLASSGEQGAKTAESFFGYTISQIPGGTDVIDSAINLGKERREEQLQPGVVKQQFLDAGYTQAQTNKLIADTAGTTQKTVDAVLELERLQAQGGLTDKEKSDKENTLRKELNTLIGDYDDVTVTFDNISSSAQDGTGAGDLALVTAFMKMLDPGSVVRESEFAQASNTGGLVSKLETILPKLQKGEILTEAQRKNFAGLASKYLTSYQKKAQEYIDQYTKIGGKYGIDPTSIARSIEPTKEDNSIVRSNRGVPQETTNIQQPKVIRGL